MDDPVARTAAAYEANPEAYDYLAENSIYDMEGERFRSFLSGRRVLDVGCGPGADLVAMVENGLDPVGLDLTERFLSDVRSRVPAASTVRADMRTLPVGDGTIDGVWCCAALLHLPRHDTLTTLEEFARVVRPDGPLYVSVHEETGDERRADRHGNEQYFTHFEGEELRDLLRTAGFEVRTEPRDSDWLSLVATRTE